MTGHKGIGLSLNADLIDGDMPTLERHLGLVADSGCEYVELILHGLDVVIGGRLNRARLEAVSRILDRFRLRRTLHLPYELNLLSPHRHRQYHDCFVAGLEFAAAAQCEVVTYHSSAMPVDPENQATEFAASFGSDPGSRYERMLEFDLDELAGMTGIAGRNGTIIGVENTAWHDPAVERSYGGDPCSVFAHIQPIAGPHLGVTMDIGHLYMAARARRLDFLEELRLSVPTLTHVHIHDNFGDSTRTGSYAAALPYGLGDLHLPVGWGTIPWESALPILLGYRGVWMMEIEFRFSPHFPEIVAGMRQRFEAIAAVDPRA